VGLSDQIDAGLAAERAALEVGPALFFSLAVITVSFLPVFTTAETAHPPSFSNKSGLGNV
jgi:hypothetical protein